MLERFERGDGDGPDCLPLIGREICAAGLPLGKRIVKLPQEFARAHRRRRTLLEAPQHVLQPTDHAGSEEVLVRGLPGLFGPTSHDSGC